MKVSEKRFASPMVGGEVGGRGGGFCGRSRGVEVGVVGGCVCESFGGQRLREPRVLADEVHPQRRFKAGI